MFRTNDFIIPTQHINNRTESIVEPSHGAGTYKKKTFKLINDITLVSEYTKLHIF